MLLLLFVRIAMILFLAEPARLTNPSAN